LTRQSKSEDQLKKSTNDKSETKESLKKMKLDLEKKMAENTRLMTHIQGLQSELLKNSMIAKAKMLWQPGLSFCRCSETFRLRALIKTKGAQDIIVIVPEPDLHAACISGQKACYI
jgi:hypothetical protein